MGGTVDGDAVPHLILHHQHPDFFKLLAQLLDVVADNAVVDVHVAVMVEHIEGAGYIDFQSRGDVLRFLFFLRRSSLYKVLQNRHILRRGSLRYSLVDQRTQRSMMVFCTGCKPVLAAHDQLTQAEDKVGFQGQRVFIIRSNPGSDPSD